MSATETNPNFRILKKPQHVHIMWLVNSNTILSQGGLLRKYFFSPTFEFCGAEWKIRLEYSFETYVSLKLQKNPSKSAGHVNFMLGVKNTHGSVLLSSNHKVSFQQQGNRYGDTTFRSYLLKNAACAPSYMVEIFCTFFDKQHFSTAAVDTPRISSIECAKTLSLNFKELYLHGTAHDIKIKVKDQEFHAHRSVLVARSPVFHAMLEHSDAEKINGEINVEDCDPNSFHDFLLFVYSGDLDIISSNNAMSLYHTANKYYLGELKTACCQCLVRELSIDLIFDATPFALKYDESELLNATTMFFIENAYEIFKSPKWEELVSNDFPSANYLLQKMALGYKKQRLN